MSLALAHTDETVQLNRATGAARLSVESRDGRSVMSDLYFAQPLRILMPRPGVGELLTAVLANLSGGIVSGDLYETDISVGSGASLTLTAQAAEKIYKSSGAEAGNHLTMRVAEGGVLEWLPQGTILFDRALFRQRVRFDLAADSTLFAGAISVLGRSAMGETFSSGRYREHWDLKRDGRLVWADRFELADPAGAAAVASGLRDVSSFATALFARPDAADDLDWAREVQTGAAGDIRCGVTAIDNNLLVMRWLGPDAMRLRNAVGAFWSAARVRWLGLPARMPVIWRI
ncbi:MULTISPECIES: urease accessory protein UreD [Nisaea]|uniref:urease accessory protein UreD n=1 Tax=Nisaea TaxID=390876 RepID=UPI000405B96E|nr:MULTISPECIES: urease accessory protein UreD [Nisaea]